MMFVKDQMRRGFKIIESWCTNNGLTVNPSKTQLVLFTNKYKYEANFTLKLFGKSVQTSEETRHLGVILDRKMSWIPHLENRLVKATRIFWALRKTMGNRWGVPPKVIHYIYTALIRPMVTYGSIA